MLLAGPSMVVRPTNANTLRTAGRALEAKATLRRSKPLWCSLGQTQLQERGFGSSCLLLFLSEYGLNYEILLVLLQLEKAKQEPKIVFKLIWHAKQGEVAPHLLPEMFRCRRPLLCRWGETGQPTKV